MKNGECRIGKIVFIKNFTSGGFMKNKIRLLVVAFMAYCATSGHSAEQLAASDKQTDISNSISETTLQTLRAKMSQARAVLSEIQDLLTQEAKILNKILDQKEQAKKNKASLAEFDRKADLIKQ
jgi:hypothetical protein